MKRLSLCFFLTLAAFTLASTIQLHASTYQVIYTFQGGIDGDQPYGPLIADASGNLYGTTEFGGSQQWGTVFKLTPGVGGSWTETVLYNFSNGTDGGEPSGNLVIDAAGNLYGTTTAGGNASCEPLHGYCGVVYELTPNLDGSYTENVLVDFTDPNGLYPQAGLTIDGAGNLYGTTYFGGAYGYGTVFELTPGTGGSWTQTILHSFDDQDGRGPNSTLVFDKSGNLYGTTNLGGSLKNAFCSDFGCGVVFELSPQTGGGWSAQVLHRFNGTSGANPNGVIFDNSGNLYGAAAYGGSGSCSGFLANGCGVVYELSPITGGAWEEKIIRNFPSSAVSAPNPVVFDASGTLLGTTELGGLKTCDSGSGCGTIYELAPGTGAAWTFTGLYGFALNRNGGFPYTGLTIGQAGNIYGTTGSGGDSNCGSFNGCGVVFQITP